MTSWYTLRQVIRVSTNLYHPNEILLPEYNTEINAKLLNPIYLEIKKQTHTFLNM